MLGIKKVESNRSNVTYEYGGKPLSDTEKAGLIRFMLEGKFDGFNIRDVMILFLILGVIATIISAYIYFF